MKMFFRTGFRGMMAVGLGLVTRVSAGETILANGNDYTTSTQVDTATTTLQAGSLSTPYSQSVSSTIDPDSANKSTTTFGLTNSHLTLGLDHLHDGTANAYAKSSGDIYFTLLSSDPNAVFHYSLSGFYKVDDVTDGKPGTSFFSVGLFEDGVTPPLFKSIQTTDSIADPSFVLGDSFGTTFSTGISAGTLEQGHTYIFSSLAYTQATNGSGGATAIGSITLDIVETPEPGILWAGGALLSVLGARSVFGRRKKPAQRA
jgi:hypothetical protein